MSRHKTHNKTSDSFICDYCGYPVTPAVSGTHHRNHCPFCLYSKHVDLRIGDRGSGCRGLMEPIGIWARKGKEWVIIHRCVKCGIIRTNRIAGDDSEVQLLILATKPFTSLPFPLESVIKSKSGLDTYGGKL